MFRTNRTFDFRQGVKSKSLAVLLDKDSIKVLLHETIVFDFNVKKDQIRLDSGGWDTPSTRITINQALSQTGGRPVYLFRRKGITYLQEGAEQTRVSFPLILKGVLHADRRTNSRTGS